MKHISLSLSTLQQKYGDEEAIRIAKQVGADCVDFNLAHYRICDPYSPYAGGHDSISAYFGSLRTFADELGIRICQTHGRIQGFNGVQKDDDVLIQEAEYDFLASSILGAPICVVHSVTTMIHGPEADPQYMHALNKDMFLRMLPHAKSHGVVIASETFGDAVHYDCCDFFGNMDEFEKSYRDIDKENPFPGYLTVCVDTGHSNKAMRFGNPKPGDIIRRLGNSVSSLHLNDNDTLTDQHKIPMTGTIDWADVFDALDEIGYNGTYNMELDLRWFGDDFMIESAAFAVKVLRHLLETRYGVSSTQSLTAK